MASVVKEVWPWEDKYGDYALVPVPKRRKVNEVIRWHNRQRSTRK